MGKTQVSSAEATEVNCSCIADKVRLLNRVITKVYDDALKPAGITTAQMNILGVVAKYGDATPRQVCDWLSMEKSTLSRNCRRLRENGWMNVIEEDGRAHRFQITAKGARLWKRIVPLWQEAQDQVRALVGDRGVRDVMRIANAVRSLDAAQ